MCPPLNGDRGSPQYWSPVPVNRRRISAWRACRVHQIPFAISVSRGEKGFPSQVSRLYERAVESPNAPLPNPYIMDLPWTPREEQFSFGKMQFLSEEVSHYRVRQSSEIMWRLYLWHHGIFRCDWKITQVRTKDYTMEMKYLLSLCHCPCGERRRRG